MGSAVGVNKLKIVTADTGGISIAFPDVCKTPSPGGPVPIPYPNIARSKDTAKGSKKVKADGKPICVKSSCFKKSVGDEPGKVGGIVSNTTRGKAEFVNCSFDVKIEGKGTPRSFDLMLHNKKNTPPFPLLQQPVVALGKQAGKGVCWICGKKL
ncbi:MAG TPA: DUF4150 domain-containing protein [Anaeromyxobacter sp.]|nr:DUF4150 domain-containing protein [Anaeromyxobacter sp.]